MNKPSDKNNPKQNDRLAEFTDKVLAGKMEQIDPHLDDELRGLEEMILRLKRAAPQIELDEATVKRMQTRLNARLQRENGHSQMNFWQKWFRSRQSRPQMVFAFWTLVFLILAIFITPLLSKLGSSTAAVANKPPPFVFLFAGLAGVGLLMIWKNHRK